MRIGFRGVRVSLIPVGDGRTQEMPPRRIRWCVMYVYAHMMNMMLVFLSCSLASLLCSLAPRHWNLLDDVFLSYFLGRVISHLRNYARGIYCNAPFGMLVTGIPRVTQNDVLNVSYRVAVCRWFSGDFISKMARAGHYLAICPHGHISVWSVVSAGVESQARTMMHRRACVPLRRKRDKRSSGDTARL